MQLAMAAKYCCTALPRSYTPDHPANREVELTAIDGALSTRPREPDSRYASVRTEDLREIQQIFHEASLADSVAHHIRAKSRPLHDPKHPLIVDYLRQKLSRPKPKSKSALAADPNQVQRIKSELRKTLLSRNGPEAGGYDEDAPVLEDVEASMAPHESEGSLARGRGKLRSQEVQVTLSSGTHDNRLVRDHISSVAIL
jgi:hypothetical protein